MNAVTPARAERAAESMQQLGEILAAWQILPDALMIIGWRNEKPPANGFASVQAHPGPRGRFQLVSWINAEAGPNVFQFVAAVQLPPGSALHADEMLLLAGQGEAGGALARLPHRFLDPTTFGTELARLSVASAITVTRFLLQAFSPAASSSNNEIRTMLQAFLERASSPDGCIEMIGAIENDNVVLQGWGAPPGPSCDVILVGARIEMMPSRIALFSRPDMRGTATGQVVIVQGAVTRFVPQIDAVVLLDRRGLRWRPVLPERRVLSGSETADHLRAVLGTLQCDASTRTMLLASLRPKFDGRFTLYDGGHPVRLAVDHAAAAEGAGTYLTGWLFDPAGVVSEVHLRSTQGGSARIDHDWTRIPRQDVTEAFRSEAALPPVPSGQHRHGFSVHVSSIAPVPNGHALYLDVAFRDGGCGFVPVTIATGDQSTIRNRLLASVDLHKSSGKEIVERHLAPFFSKLTDADTSSLTVAVPTPRGWTTAIVVPLADSSLPRALLSQFLRDPLGDTEGMVFICGDNWTDTAIEALAALARFYGVQHSVSRINGQVTPVSALATAAAVSDAKQLLLLGPGTIGRGPGWRQLLYAALDAAERPACVSPTVVYEDDSVRFGGSDAIEPLETAPYIRIRRRLAGMPVSIIRTVDPEPSSTVSPDCCLVHREALRNPAAVAGTVASSSAQEVAISMLMGQNGIEMTWVAAAQVYAADASGADMHENTIRVGNLVDGWCLRACLGEGA